MANIIQNFTENLLDLTSNGTYYETFDERNGDYIRVSILTTAGDLLYTFYSDRQWLSIDPVYFGDEYQPFSDAGLTQSISYEDIQVPIYRDSDGKIYVKPNEIFDLSTEYNLKRFAKGDHVIRFDFIRSIKLNNNLVFANTEGYVGTDLEFYIGEISTSRREVRIVGRQTIFDSDLNDGEGGLVPNDSINFENTIGNFESEFGNPDSDEYPINLFLTIDDVNHTITNYEFDNVSDDNNTTLVLKLHKPLPSTVELYSSVDIIKEIYPTQFEEVKYFDEQIVDLNITTLDPDWSVGNTQDVSDEVNFNQSYNDLIHSSSLPIGDKASILYKMFSGSEYDNLNIDYDTFETHAFFGSAEYKLRNFYDKIKLIESYSIDLSASMNHPDFGLVTGSADVIKRQQIFSYIDTIVSNFTPYEYWMYNDFSSSNSWPSPGKNYAKSPPISGSFSGSAKNDISSDAEILGNHFGMDVVYKISTADNYEFVTSGSFASADSLLNTVWDTGSAFDGHATASNDGGWYFAGNKAYFSGSNTTTNNLIQSVFTSSDSSTTEQFIQGQTYKIEFDVTDLYNAGEVRFDLGVGAGTTQRKSFNISSTGHQKDLLQLNTLQPEPNNKLLIKGLNGFSGSIDNISITRTTDEDGRADIFTDVYHADNPVFGNYDGRWYLSFWGKFQELPIWQNSNSTSSIPNNAFSGEYTQSSWHVDKNEGFHHFVLAASQSYWRFPDDSAKQSDALTPAEAENTSFGWEILTGHNVTGSYVMEDLIIADEYRNLITHGGRSILPSGELFRLYHLTSSQDNQPVTQSLITDVKLWRGDSFNNIVGSDYNATINDVVPFTNVFATSSKAVDDWYQNQLASASLYDKENIHSLYNTLPSHVRTSDTNRLLEKYLSAMGEQFDIIKNYIDNYLNLNKRSYDKYDSVPDNLLEMVANNLGWEFFDTNAFKGLLENVVGSYGDDSDGQFTKQIWKNILNNLIYIYKSKGTDDSIRSLINTFGIPSNVITVADFGANDIPQIRQSPGIYDVTSNLGIRNSSGSAAFVESVEPFYFLNFNENNHSFTPKWNRDGTGHVNSIEFMFTTHKNNDQVLMKGSGSQGDWSMGINQSPESSSGQMTFYFSQSFDIDSDPIGTIVSTVTSTTRPVGEFPVTSSLNETKVWHVLLEKIGPAGMHFKVAHKPSPRIDNNNNPNQDDTILYSASGSMIGGASVFEAFTSSHAPWAEESLVFGPNFTGSMTNMTIYNTAIPSASYSGHTQTDKFTEESFLEHVFNPNSVSRINVDRTILPVWRYNFKEFRNTNIESGSTIRNQYPQTDLRSISERNSFSDTFHETLDPTFTNPNVSKKYLTTFRFNPRGIDNFNSPTNKTVKIGEKPEFIYDHIKPDKVNVFSKTDDSDRVKSTKKQLFLSPVTKIDNMISDVLSDKDFSSALSVTTVEDKELDYYPQLRTLNEYIFKTIIKDTVNINDWIRRNENLIPSELFEYLDRLTPVEIDATPGMIIASHKLHRNKHVWGRQTGRAATGRENNSLLETNKLIFDIDFADTQLLDVDVTQARIINKFILNETAKVTDVLNTNPINKSLFKINSIQKLIDIFELSDLIEFKKSVDISAQFSTPYTLFNQVMFNVEDNYTFFNSLINQLVSNNIDKDVLKDITSTLTLHVGDEIDLLDAISSFKSSLMTVLFQELYTSISINKLDYTLKDTIVNLFDYIKTIGLSDRAMKLKKAKKIMSELLDNFYTTAISKTDLLNIIQASIEQMSRLGLEADSINFDSLLNLHSKYIGTYLSNPIYKATDLVSRKELQRIMFEFILLIKPKDNLNLQYTLHSTFMTIFFSELLGVIDKTIDVEFKSSLNHHNIGIDTSRLNKADLYQILASMKEVIVIFADIDKGVVLNINADKLVQYLSNSIDLSEFKDLQISLFDQYGEGLEILWEPEQIPDDRATASLSFPSAISVTNSYHGRSFTLISTDGTEKKFVWDNAGTAATGAVGLINSVKHVYIQIQGMSSFGDIKNETVTAINSANGHSGRMSAEAFSKAIVVTQLEPGSAGNTVTTTSGSLAIGLFSAGDFTGGDEKTYYVKKDSPLNSALRKKHNLESENIFLIGQDPPKVQDRDGVHYAGQSEVTSSKLFGVINLHDEVFGNSFDRGDLNGKLRDWNAPIGKYLNPNNTTHFIYNPDLEEARRDGSSPYRYDRTKFGFHFKSYQASPTSSYAYNSYPIAKYIGETERYVGAPKHWYRPVYSDSDGNWHRDQEWQPQTLDVTGSDLYYDAADKKQFMNRMRDYTPGVNSGKLIGSTVQIEIDANGNIHYPPGHLLFSTDHSFRNQMNEGTINHGTDRPYDPTGRVHPDNHPNYGSSSVYAWDVNGQALINQG